MATTRPACRSSASVSPPGPGPISRTVSAGGGADRLGEALEDAGSWRKCWPSRRLGRDTPSDPQDQERDVVARVRREGAAPRRSARTTMASGASVRGAT